MTQDEMSAIAHELRLLPFDLMLVADGSGTVYTKPCGWCCVAYEPHDNSVVEHFGGVSAGTNNYAEIAPFAHALWAYNAKICKRCVTPTGCIRAELVSDSEITVGGGNGTMARNANGSLWASIDWFVNNGYSLHWNHVPRNSNAANKLCDKRGRGVRLLLESNLLTVKDNIPSVQ